MSKVDKATDPKLNKVKLLRPHKHEGVEHLADAEIEVNDADKEWLIEQQIIAGKTGAEPASQQPSVTGKE